MAGENQLRVLELFAGIGGCAAALGEAAQVVAAIDINAAALAVYRHNFTHRTLCRTLESLPAAELAQFNADLWWLSPPCQPYTRKGNQRDWEDPRAASLRNVIRCIEQVQPQYVALENVPPFGESLAREHLRRTLERSGYFFRERLLCPSELGVPNRRRRYYLLASRVQLPDAAPLRCNYAPLAQWVDRAHDDDPRLLLEPEIAAQFAGAIDIVDADDPQAITSCFAAAYGRSIVRSGSYLRTPYGLRRFAPSEVQRLLGFPKSYSFPAGLSNEQRWRLLGNSLSLPAVREVLRPVLRGGGF
jgi:site-specific DNA-cytosine methylase